MEFEGGWWWWFFGLLMDDSEREDSVKMRGEPLAFNRRGEVHHFGFP